MMVSLEKLDATKLNNYQYCRHSFEILAKTLPRPAWYCRDKYSVKWTGTMLVSVLALKQQSVWASFGHTKDAL